MVIGGHSVKMKTVRLPLSIGDCPPVNILFMCPPFLNIFWALMCSKDCGCEPQQEFHLRVSVVKAILWGHAEHLPVQLLPP